MKDNEPPRNDPDYDDITVKYYLHRRNKKSPFYVTCVTEGHVDMTFQPVSDDFTLRRVIGYNVIEVPDGSKRFEPVYEDLPRK